MNTDTGTMRELAKDEKPEANEVVLEKGQQFRIGRACFMIVAVDPGTDRIIAQGIPRALMNKNRRQRRKEAADLRKQMRSGQKLKSIEIPT